MENEEKIIDVDAMQIVEDAHDKIDLLVSMLEKKGVLGKGEFDKRYGEFVDELYTKE